MVCHDAGSKSQSNLLNVRRLETSFDHSVNGSRISSFISSNHFEKLKRNTFTKPILSISKKTKLRKEGNLTSKTPSSADRFGDSFKSDLLKNLIVKSRKIDNQ